MPIGATRAGAPLLRAYPNPMRAHTAGVYVALDVNGDDAGVHRAVVVGHDAMGIFTRRGDGVVTARL